MRKINAIALAAFTSVCVVVAVAVADSPDKAKPQKQQTQEKQKQQPQEKQPQPKQAQQQSPEVQKTRADIQQKFGFVPGFLDAMPDAALPGFWMLIKSLEANPDTALDNKTKQLVSLGVAAQIPCEYCIYFHTQAARAHGATEQEIEEAIGMAAITRFGSTVLNGLMVDEAAFKKDVDRMIKQMSQPAPRKSGK